MCQDFFKEGRLFNAKDRLCTATNSLSDFFRENSYPVIWVRQEFKADLSDAFLSMRKQGIQMTIEGTDGAKLLPELKVQPTDLEIIKKRYSAFFSDRNGFSVSKTESRFLSASWSQHTRLHSHRGRRRIPTRFRNYIAIDSYDQGFHEDTKRYLEGRVGTFMPNAEITRKFAVLRNG